MIKKLLENVNVQRVGALVIGIAVLAYSVYHVASLFGEDISTIPTGVTEDVTVIDGKGYIFRDETPLYSSNSGVTDYLKSNGSKVSVGEALADVYERGSKSEKKAVKYFDEKIAILSKSVDAGYTIADLPEVNGEISDSYYSIVKMMATGDMGGVDEVVDELLFSMNCHELLTAENSLVDKTLEEMISKREGVFEASGTSVVEYATKSGYFYTSVDGFETNFTISATEELTAERFYELVSSRDSIDQNVVDKAYGKLADSNEWRFVVRLSATNSGYFKTGNEYSVEFVENGYKVIPMTLLSSIDDTEYGGRILVFRANRLPAGFVFDRCQSISVEVSSQSGIYVPRSAVHKLRGEPCVYVLKGSVVRVRRIEIVYEARDYYLVSTESVDNGGIPYLDTNELLIVGGSNLFDGRILD